MKALIFLLIPILFISCSKTKVEFDLKGKNPTRIISGVTTPLEIKVASSTYPLVLDISGLRLADRIYVLQGADNNCVGGKDVGFEFVHHSSGKQVVNVYDVEYSGSIRILVYNSNDRLCSPAVSFNLGRRLFPKVEARELALAEFRQTSPAIPFTGIRNSKGVLSLGYFHSCFVTNGGEVNCFGRNISGQLGNGTTVDSHIASAVSGITQGVQVSSGSDHTCSLLSTGEINCWGQNYRGQLGDGTTNNSYFPVRVSLSSEAIQVVASGVYNPYSCALLESGRVSCWGDNSSGQLGDGTFDNSQSPVEVLSFGGTPLENVAAISAGNAHMCALHHDGQVSCWGRNNSGQLGNGTINDSNQAVSITLGARAVDLSLGEAHSCFILEGGTVSCFGDNIYGQLGNNSTDSSSIPVTVSGITNAVEISSGYNHTCALLDSGSIECWGPRSYGRLGGNNQSASAIIPEPVYGITDAKSVRLGGMHSCAILENDTLRCWGHNDYGQLGDNTTTQKTSPVYTFLGYDQFFGDVITPMRKEALFVGSQFQCFIQENGRVNCWGDNSYGQLGNASNSISKDPVEVSNLTGATSMSVGRNHACAVTSNGTVRCWGLNDYGQLGNNTTDNSNIPVSVLGISNAIDVYAGATHTCALLSTQELECWGSNIDGKLGNNASVDSLVPVRVVNSSSDSSSLTNIISVSAGNAHTCAALSSGKVKCWGRARLLGSSPMSSSLGPVEVHGISDAVGVRVGDGHSCVLHASGKVSCWGDGLSGELGYGLRENTLLPVEVVGINNAVSISTGGDHSCAVLADGSLSCWGFILGDISDTPRMIEGVSRAISVGGHSSKSCIITQNKQIFCIGAEPASSDVNKLFYGQKNSGFTIGAGPWGCIILPSKQVQCTGPIEFIGITPIETPAGLFKFENTFPIPGLANIKTLAGSTAMTCALSEAGEVNCWGPPYGNGQLQSIALPVGERFVKLIEEGLYGSNLYGISNEGKVYRLSPGMTSGVELSLTGKYVNFYTNSSGNQCAEREDHKIFCQGPNYYGQLGLDQNANPSQDMSITSFREIPAFEGAKKLALFGQHSCGIFGADNELRCVGSNYQGQLGVDPALGNTTHIPTLTGITGLSDLIMSPNSGETRTIFVKNGEIHSVGGTSYVSEKLGLQAVTMAKRGTAGIYVNIGEENSFMLFSPAGVATAPDAIYSKASAGIGLKEIK